MCTWSLVSTTHRQNPPLLVNKMKAMLCCHLLSCYSLFDLQLHCSGAQRISASGPNHILKSGGGRRSQRLTGFESFFPKTNIFQSTLRSKRSFMVTNGLSCYFYGSCRSWAPRIIITFLLHMAAPANHKLQVCWSTETCHLSS